MDNAKLCPYNAISIMLLRVQLKEKSVGEGFVLLLLLFLVTKVPPNSIVKRAFVPVGHSKSHCLHIGLEFRRKSGSGL